jgi:hypothetical protein
VKITPTLPAAALVGLLALGSAAAGRAQATDPHPGQDTGMTHAPDKPAPLSDGVRAGIEEALRDELRGEGLYARVLKDHGEVRPFSNVVRAERRHVAFLEGLLKDRGLPVATHPAGAEVPGYASVKEACAAAVAFETRNVALYDRLLATGPLPGDVKQAFDHNRMASLDHHKPAFERCAGVTTAQRVGRGPGPGHGPGPAAGCGQGCAASCGHHGCGQGGHGHGSGPGSGCGEGCGNGRGPYGCGHGGSGHGRQAQGQP